MNSSALAEFLHRALGEVSFRIVPLRGDGSERRFFRVFLAEASLVAVDHGERAREAASFLCIGRHLFARGIPVPRILAHDTVRFFLMEDLGDEHLQDRVSGKEAEQVLYFYRRAVEILIRIQERAFRGFDPSWCLEAPVYTGAFAFERESLYFLNRFVRGVLGWEEDAGALERELRRLARGIDAIRGNTLMHRDYQSRNLMIHQGDLAVIDYQGARMGPPHYDLASLLYDPYTAVPPPLRERLIGEYRSKVGGAALSGRFLEDFHLVAVHRMMQVLGAFAFLGYEKGKPGFCEHIPAAVRHLLEIWTRLESTPFPALNRLMHRIREHFLSAAAPGGGSRGKREGGVGRYIEEEV